MTFINPPQEKTQGTPQGTSQTNGVDQQPSNLDFGAMLLGGLSFDEIKQAENSFGIPAIMLPKEEFLKKNPQYAQDPDFDTKYKSMVEAYTTYADVETQNSLPSKSLVLDPKYLGMGLIPDPGKGVYFRGNTLGGMIIQNDPQEIAYGLGHYLAEDGRWKNFDSGKVDGYLKLETGKEGEPSYFFREVDKDTYVPPEQLLSAFGPKQAFTESVWSSLGRGFVAGAALIPKGFGGLIETVGDLIDPNNDSKWSDIYGQRLVNHANYWTKQNQDESRPYFSNMRSFMWTTANGIAQLTGVIATAYLTGGTLTYAGMGRGAASIISEQASLLLGSAEAAVGFREQMKDMGVPEKDIARWYWPFFTATYISENVIGANVTQRAFGRGMRSETGRMIGKVVGKFKDDFGVADQVTKAERSAFFKNTMRQLWRGRQGFRKWIEEAPAAAKIGIGAGEETVEEWIEGGLDYGVYVAFNNLRYGYAENFVDEYGKATFEPVSSRAYQREGVEGKVRVMDIVPAGMDYLMKIPGQPDKYITEKEMSAIKEDLRNAQAVLNGEQKFDPNFGGWDQGWAAGVSTLITLGFGGMINTMGIRNKKIQDEAEIQQAWNELRRSSSKKWFDRGLQDFVKRSGRLAVIDEKGNPVKPGQGNSVAEKMASLVRQRIDFYKTIGRDLGVDNEMMVQIYGGEDLLNEGVMAMKSRYDLEQIRNQMKSEEWDGKPIEYDGQSYSNEADIDKEVKVLDEKIKEYTEITDWGVSEAYRKKQKIVRANVAAKGVFMELIGGPAGLNVNSQQIIAKHVDKFNNWILQAKAQAAANRLLKTQGNKLYGKQFEELAKDFPSLQEKVNKLPDLKGEEHTKALKELSQQIFDIHNQLQKTIADIDVSGLNLENAAAILPSIDSYMKYYSQIDAITDDLLASYAREANLPFIGQENVSSARLEPDIAQLASQIVNINAQAKMVIDNPNELSADIKTTDEGKAVEDVLFGDLFKRVDDIRKRAKEGKEKIGGPGDEATIKEALEEVTGLMVYFTAAKELNRMDRGNPATKGENKETFSGRVKRGTVTAAEGISEEYGGNILSDEQIDRYQKKLQENFDGKGDEMSVPELAELLNINQETLLNREKRRRLEIVNMHIGFINGLLNDVESPFSDVITVDVSKLAEDVKAVINGKSITDIEADTILGLEKRMAKIKSDMYTEIHKSPDKFKTWRQDAIIKYALDLNNILKSNNAQFVGYGHEPYDGTGIDEDLFSAGMIETSDKLTHRIDFSSLPANVNDLFEIAKNSEDRELAIALAHVGFMRFVNLVNEIHMIDNVEFYEKYAVIRAIDDFDKSKSNRKLSIQQEEALKIIYMSLFGKDTFKTIALYKEEEIIAKDVQKKHWAENLSKDQNIDEIAKIFSGRTMDMPLSGVLLQGTGGAGKTTFMLSAIADMLQEVAEANDLSYDLVLVGPDKQNTTKQTASIGSKDRVTISKRYDIKTFMSNLKKINTGIGKIIVIDEASLLNDTDMRLIYKKFKGTGTQIIFMGDPQQPRSTVGRTGTKDNTRGIDAQAYVIRTNLITEVHRSDIESISAVQKAIGRSISGISSDDIAWPPNVKHNSDHTKGVYYANSITGKRDIETLFVQDVERHGAEGRVIIFAYEQDAINFREQNPQINPDQIRYFIQAEGSTDELGTAQGNEFKYVYAAVNLTNDTFDKRIVKGMAGRAIKFLAIPSTEKSSIDEDILDTSEIADNSERAQLLRKRERSVFTSQLEHIRQLGNLTSNSTEEQKVEAKSDNVVNQSTEEKTKKNEKKEEKERSEEENIPEKTDKVPISKSLSKQDLEDVDQNEGIIYGQNIPYKVIGTGKMKSQGREVDGIRLRNIQTGKETTRTVGTVQKMISDNREIMRKTEDPSRIEHILKKSAENYEKHLLPVSAAVLPGTKAVNNYDQAIADYVNQSLKMKPAKFDMVFHKTISLINANNGKPELHHNVITLESNGRIFYTLYQPLFNKTELKKYNNGKLRKSRSDLGLSHYTNPKIDEAVKPYSGYMNFLAERYAQGIRMSDEAGTNSVVIGTINNDHITESGGVVLEPGKSRPVSGLLNELLSNGGYVFGYRGGKHNDPNGAIRIIQKSKNGAVMDYIEVTRTGMINQTVLIPVFGPKLSDPAVKPSQLKKDVASELKKLRRLAKNADEATGRRNKADAAKKFAYALNGSISFQTVLYNQSKYMITDPETGEKTVSESAMQNLVVFDGSFLDINNKGGFQRQVERLETAYKWIADHDGYFPLIKAAQDEPNIIRLDPKHIGILTTHVQKVNMPNFLLKLNESTFQLKNAVGQNVSRNDSPISTDDSIIDSSLDALPDDDGIGMEKAPIRQENPEHYSQAVDYLNKVFGTSYNLEFSEDVRVNNRAVWGKVHEWIIHIERKNGNVQVGVARHEAVHYAMRHFLSPQQFAAVIKDAKRLMKSEGYNGEPSDYQAEEYIAEINEGVRKVKPKSLLSRFINWIRNAMNFLFNNRQNVRAFINDLNNGYFANLEAMYSNASGAIAMSKTTLRDLIPDETVEDMYNINFGPMKRQEMSRLMRNEKNLNALVLFTRNIIWHNSLLGRPLADNTLVTDDMLIDVVKRQFANLASRAEHQNYLNLPSPAMIPTKNGKMAWMAKKALSDDRFMESLLKNIIPEYNIDSRVIEARQRHLFDDGGIEDRKKAMSSVVKNHLILIPVHSYTVVKKTKEVYRKFGVAKQMNLNKLDHILGQVANEVHNYGEFDEPNAVLRWMERLYDRAVQYGSEGENEKSNLIFSFLEAFGGFQADISEKGYRSKVGYRLGREILATNREDLAKQKISPFSLVFRIGEIYANLGYVEAQDIAASFRTPISAAVYDKLITASQLMAALATTYLSSQRSQIINIEMRGSPNRRIFQAIHKFNTNSQELKRIFVRSASRKFYTSIGLQDNVEDRVTGLVRNSIDIRDDGLYYVYNRKESSRLLAYENGKWIWAKEGNEKPTVEDVQNLAKFFGIYIQFNTAKAILGQDFVSDMSADDFADLMGSMASALRAYFEKNKNNIHHKRAAGYLRRSKTKIETMERPLELTDVNVNELTEEEKDALAIQESEFRAVKNRIHLKSFYTGLQQLAKVETEMNILIKSNFSILPNGKRMYEYILGNNISRTFVNSEDFEASLAAINKMRRELNKTDDKDLWRNPFVEMREGRMHILEPLLDENSDMSISQVFYSGGIGSDYYGKGINDLTTRDQYNHVLFGYYLTSLMRTAQDQQLQLTTVNFTDSNQFPIFAVNFGKKAPNHLVQTTVDNGNLMSAQINKSMLFDLMDRKFQIAHNKFRASMIKWTGVDPATLERIKPGNEVVNFSDADLKSLAREKSGKRSRLFMEMLNKKITASPLGNTTEIKQMLSQLDLVEGADFEAEGDVITLGRTSTMNDSLEGKSPSPFEMQNWVMWEKMKQEFSGKELYDVSKDFLDGMFKDRYWDMVNELKKNQITLPDQIQVWEPTKKGLQPWGRKVDKRYFEGTTDEVRIKWEFNPFLESYMYAQFLASDSIESLVVGRSDQTSDPQKASKNAKSGIAQGQLPMPMQHIGLGEKVNMVTLQDINRSDANLSKFLGKDIDYSSTDGAIITFGLFTSLLQDTYGGNLSNMKSDDTSVKTVSSGVNFQTGYGHFGKSAMYKINDDWHDMNPTQFDKLMKFFLTGALDEEQKNLTKEQIKELGYDPNLYNVYKHSMEQQAETTKEPLPSVALENVKSYVLGVRIAYGVDLMENTVSMIAFGSTEKMAVPGMNYISLDDILKGDERTIIKQRNTQDILFQLNANQDINRAYVKDPIQIKLLSGIGSSAGMEIERTDAVLMKRALGKLDKTFGPNKFAEELLKLGGNLADRMSNATVFADIMGINNLSINIPSVMMKLYPSLNKEYEKAVSINVPGLKMVQAPGELMANFREIKTDNGTITATNKDLQRGIITKAQWDKARSRVLKPVQVVDNQIIPAEVVMPFVFAEQFGIDRSKRYTLNEILTFNVEGQRVNLRAYLKENVPNYYRDKEAVRAAILDFMKQNFKKEGFKEKSFFKNVDDSIDLSDYKKLADYYANFLDSLDVFSTRIPTSTKGLSFAGEIVAFTYDSGNLIYVNGAKSEFDDSDYDIDQLTVLFRTFSLDTENNVVRSDRIVKGKKLANHSNQALLNHKFETLYNEWTNMKNSDLIFMSLSTEEAKARADENLKSKRMFDNHLPTDINNFDAAHSGKNMVGVFANVIHAYAKLNHLTPKQRQNLFDNTFGLFDDGKIEKDGKTDYIIRTLGEMLQISVDNPKLMILSLLNINQTTGSFIAAMAMTKMTRDEIYDMLAQSDVQDVFQRALVGRSIDTQNFDPIEHINKKIRLIKENQLNDAILEEQRLNRHDFYVRKLKELEQQQRDNIKLVQLFEGEDFDDDMKAIVLDELFSKSLDKRVQKEAKKSIQETEKTIQEMIDEKLSVLLQEGEITRKGSKYVLNNQLYNEKDIKDVVRTQYLIQDGRFQDLIARQNISIGDKIRAIKGSVEQTSDENAAEYYDFVRKVNTKKLARLEQIRDLMLKGEAIKRLVPFFQLYDGPPADIYEQEKLMHDLQFNAGTSIEHIINPKVKSDYNWLSEGRFLNRDVVSADWNNATQGMVDKYATSVISNVVESIRENNIDVSDVTLNITGESGFDEAFAKAASRAGMTVNVFMPKANLYTLRNGRKRYDDERVQSSKDRFKGYKVNFIETDKNNRGKVLYQSLYYLKGNKYTSSVDFRVLLPVHHDSMVNFVKKMKPGGIRTIEFNGSEMANTDDMILKVSDSISQEIMANAEKKGALQKKGVTFSIVGSDLGFLNIPRVSEYQQWLENETQIRKAFPDVPALIRSFPATMQHLKAFQHQTNLRKSQFMWFGPNMQMAFNKMFSLQKQTFWTSKTQFYAFQEEAQKAVLHEMFTNITDPDLTKINLTKFNERDIGSSEVYGRQFPASIANHVDLSRYEDSLYFVMEFPNWVEAVKNDPSLHENNLFLQNLVIDERGISMRNHLDLTEPEVNARAQAFELLPTSVKKMFVAYNLLRNGFRNSRHSLSDYIGVYYMEEISHMIEEVNNNDQFWADFERHFVENALTNNTRLIDYISQQKAETTEHPHFSKRYKYFNSGSRIALTTRYNPETDEYFQVYKQASGFLHRLPLHRETFSEEETVLFKDIEHLRSWIDQGKTTLEYLWGHDYKGLRGVDETTGKEISWALIRVGMDVAEIINPSFTKLGLKKVDETVYEDMRAKSIPLGPVASKDIVKKKRLSNRALQSFINALDSNVPVRTVNNQTTAHPGLKAYIQDGILHYNEDLVTVDSPMHEIAHVFLWKYMDNEVLEDAREDVINNTPLVKAIKFNYPGLDTEQLIFEVAATKLGFASEKLIHKYFVQPNRSFIQRLVDFAKRIWNSIFNRMNNDLDADVEFNIGDTINQAAEKIMNQLLRGEFKIGRNEIMNMQREFGEDLTASKSLSSINDLEDDLLLKGTKKDSQHYILRAEALDIWNRMKLDPNSELTLKVGTETIDLTKEHMADDDEAAVAKIINKYIIPNQKYGTAIQKAVWKWLENSAEGGHGKINHMVRNKFFDFGGLRGNNRFRTKLINFKNYIGWSEQAVKYKLSQLGDYDPLFKNAVEREFLGDDPSIVIHRVQKTADGQIEKADISIILDLPNRVNFSSTGLEGKLITANYISDDKAKSMGVDMRANLANVKKIKLMLTVMRLKQKFGDRINIRNVGISEMAGTNLKFDMVSPIMIMKNLRALSNIPEFMNALPPIVQSVLSGENVFDPAFYSENEMESLLTIFRERLGRNESTDNATEETKLVRESVRLIENYLQGEGGIKELLFSLRLYRDAHARDARNRYDDYDPETDPLYNLISMALFEINSLVKPDKSNTQQVSWWQYWNVIQSDQKNLAVQTFYNIFRNEMAQVQGLFMKYQDSLANETRKIMTLHRKKHPGQRFEWIADLSENYFKKFFIYKTINGVRINTYTIHHDRNNPETKEALRTGLLSEDEFKYSQYIADEIEKWMKSLLNTYYRDNPTFWDGVKLNEEKLNEHVDLVYGMKWKKGMIPLMKQNSSSYIFQGKPINALRKFFYSTKNPDKIFLDVLENEKQSIENEKVPSVFLSQLQDDEFTDFAGKFRLEKMGLDRVDGVYTVSSKSQNEQWTVNLFNIVKHIAMDGLSKPVIDEKILPAWRESIIAARTMAIISNDLAGFEMTKRHLKTYLEKVVYGKHQPLSQDKNIQELEGWGRLALRITTFNGVALSVPVAITSFTANAIESIMTSISTNISRANPYKVFGFQHWTRAAKEYITNYKKMNAILNLYQVIETDRFDLMMMPKYDVTQLHPYHSQGAHFMNRWTDISMRQIAATAQMMFEGTYDAHTVKNGKVYYDAKKDKRFKNYKNDPKQKVLLEGLVNDLTDDLRTAEEQKGKELPVRAYGSQDQRKLEWVGSQFVIGAYNQETTPNGDTMFTWNAIWQFKKFLTTKLHERLGSSTTVTEGGYWTVEEDEEGNYKRAWASYIKEGSWVTAGKILLKSTPFISSILAKYEWVSNTHSLLQIRQMSELERYNLVRASFDLIMFVAMYYAYVGLQGLWDNDKYSRLLRVQRILRSLKNGFTTGSLTSPNQLLELMFPLPIVSTATRMMKILMGQNVQQNSSLMVPLSGTYRMFDDIFSDINDLNNLNDGFSKR